MTVTISFSTSFAVNLVAYISMVVIGYLILGAFGTCGLILIIGGSFCLFFGFFEHPLHKLFKSIKKKCD